MNKLTSFYFPIIQSSFLCVALLCGTACVNHGSKKPFDVTASSESFSLEQTNDVDKQNWKLEFSEDFNAAEIGTEPEEIFILDGDYTVQELKLGNKALLLPGTPMGEFGLLFGPRIKDQNLELSFSFFATKQGRRMPSVSAGIGGMRGYRMRLNPAIRKIVLSQDEVVLKEVAFSWTGGKWWNVRFRATAKEANQSTQLQIKLWPKMEKEPVDWFFSEKFKIEYEGGKCALWGYPYSSKEILFDDLMVLSSQQNK